MSRPAATPAKRDRAAASGMRFLLRLTLSPEEQDELWELGRDIELLGGLSTDNGYLFGSERWRDAAAEHLAETWGPWYFVSVDQAISVSGPADSRPLDRDACGVRVVIAACEGEDSRALAHLLAQHGFEVRPALDGLDCLDLLQTYRPQLLVMDDQLLWGGSDGVVARLRDDLQELSVPVILIGSAACGRIGPSPAVDEYLHMPVEPDELLRALHRALKPLPAATRPDEQIRA